MAKKTFSFRRKISDVVLVASCMLAVLTLDSCYTTTVSVGNMNPTDPAIEANTAHNGHFIGGLVNATSVEDDVYVGDAKQYLIKSYTSVGDVAATIFSFGLFAPTTTKFYLPLGSELPPRVHMPPVRLGVRGGLNFSSPSIDGNPYVDISGRMGYKVGLILDVPMTPSVYFQPGLYYSSKGGKVGDENLAQDYIEVPLLLSYRFGVPNILASVTNGSSFTRGMQLQAHVGPYFGVANTRDFGDDKFDAGIQLGLGGLFLNHYYIGLSYDYSFRPDGGEVRNTRNPTDFTNRNFSINIGYNF